MRKLFQPSEEAKEIWRHNIFIMTGMHEIKETATTLEVTYHVIQKIFLTIAMVLFGPVFLILILTSIFDLSTAPLWAVIIAYLISGTFTLGTITIGLKPYMQPTKLILDKEFKRIILKNPDQKYYEDDKLWPDEISIKDIKDYRVYKRRDMESRKDDLTIILNMKNGEKLLIFSSQNQKKFDEIEGFLHLQLGVSVQGNL